MRIRNRKPRGNYAFIDSQNLNLGVQKMGWKMDWRKFRQFLKDKYNVTHAYMFIGYIAENEAMYEQLHDSGYLIVLKRTQEIKDPEAAANGEKNGEAEEKKLIKGNIDAELVVWAMKEQPNYEKAIIVSGDGDFYALLEYLAQQKKLLHLMVPNWRYSNLLKDFSDYIVRIDQLRGQLAYRDHRFGRQKKAKN